MKWLWNDCLNKKWIRKYFHGDLNEIISYCESNNTRFLFESGLQSNITGHTAIYEIRQLWNVEMKVTWKFNILIFQYLIFVNCQLNHVYCWCVLNFDFKIDNKYQYSSSCGW